MRLTFHDRKIVARIISSIEARAYYAVKKGLIKRLRYCERCGVSGKMIGHHNDYTKPLNIEWLCRRCHSRLHGASMSDEMISINKGIAKLLNKNY